MVSHPVWGGEFEKIRFPYNIGVLAQESAVFALDNWDEICRNTLHIVEMRDQMVSGLRRMGGVQVFPHTGQLHSNQADYKKFVGDF